jgi:hypothetical protein
MKVKKFFIHAMVALTCGRVLAKAKAGGRAASTRGDVSTRPTSDSG